MTVRKPILENYLAKIAEIRATGAGVEETSYYPAIEGALDEVGRSLKPRVQCVLQIANRGAGLPDGGLFTADQYRKTDVARPLLDQMPARGVVEIKPPSADLDAVLGSEQIERYWKKYGLVLVTNYRAFALVGASPDGRPAVLERFLLAPDEEAFWGLARHPRSTGTRLGTPFDEYLRRVLLHNAPLAAPRDVAAILASYARDALTRVEHADLPALSGLRSALSEALGLRFEGERGEHFFRSTLVQTLFYGVFAAWVLWTRAGRGEGKGSFQKRLKESGSPYGAAPDRFDWRSAEWTLRLPVIRALFEQVATPSKLGPLGLVEILDWTAAALNRVDQTEFFRSFDEGHAVQYFYEPFLEAFDPALRKELGVWYTPEEIVEYQVARVDTVLREELGILDGLADPNVFVLDPCCGTGAYLRRTLARIAETLRDKGGDALVAHDLKRAAMERVFGFEILPAPFVISHLQLGLLLQNLGAPLSEAKAERVGVYLTNSLVGWEPPKGPKQRLIFPEMEEERDAAERIKRDTPILVILGNPPYNAFAGTSPEEEAGLVEPYKEGLIREWGIKKFNLDDLYVRFFRLAEKRVAEMTGRGVVSFISNHSWISEPSFVVLRKKLLAGFDRFWIENMHGNRKISEYAPDGRTSETVFAIPGFSAGIQQGVAISLWVRSGKKSARGQVLFRDDLDAARAVERRAQLLESLRDPGFSEHYEAASPSPENRYSFRPGRVPAAYYVWPKVTELCAAGPFNGPVERRGNSLVVMSTERAGLEGLKLYLDPNVQDSEILARFPEWMLSSGEFDATKTRLRLKGAVDYKPAAIQTYPFKPFDMRLAYLDPRIQPLFSRPSPELLGLRFEGNAFLLTRDTADKSPEGVPFYFSTLISDYDCVSGHARHFPLMLLPRKGKGGGHDRLFEESRLVANLSDRCRGYLRSVGCEVADGLGLGSLIWLHVLAVGYSPAYLDENADGLRQDWPRVPLPAKKERLEASAELGRRVAALLDVEKPAPGVTCGSIEPAYRDVAVIARAEGKAIDPDAGDLDVTAGWGHAGKGGVTMPGRGKITERGDALDVWLNDVACWRNVPRGVWEYTIGGYQVMKKWLSYREKSLLGRGLTSDEARYVTEMARRIAALLALQPALDENYEAVRKDAVDFTRFSGQGPGA